MSISRLLLLFLLSICLIGLDGRKVRERFNPLPSDFVFKVVMMIIPGMEGQVDGNPLDDLIKGMNISIVKAKQSKIGECINYETGEYDGWIGYVQRNEANFLPQFVRPDSTPFEPGIFVTFSALDDSPRIFSNTDVRTEVVMTDILYLWTNFDEEIWIYFVISLITSSVLFVMIACALEIATIRDVMNGFFQSFWNYFVLSVDMAPTTILPFKSAIILWTCVVLAIYYAIHVILMGTLSTDLTVPSAIRSIEKLNDLLYDPQFNQTTPVITRSLNMYSVLRSSRPGTQERALFERLIQNESVSVKEIDANDKEGMGRLIGQMIDDAYEGKIAIIENSQFILPSLIYGICYFKPKFISAIKASEEIIAQSMMAGLMSKETPIEAQKLIQYRIHCLSEGALMKGLSQAMGRSMLQSMANVEITTEGQICAEKFDHTYKEELDLPWEILDLTPFKRMIRICLGWIFFAGVILVYEKVHRWHHDRRTKIKVRRITKVNSHPRFRRETKLVRSDQTQSLKIDIKHVTFSSR